MALEVREHAVSVNAESSYGSDPTSGSPSAWMSVLEDGPKISPQRPPVEDETVRAIHSGQPHESFESHNDVNIPFYLRGKEDTAGDAPLWAPILQAAGFEETITASTSAAYSLITYHTDAAAPAMTVFEDRYYNDGNSRRFEANGVRGNLAFNFEMDAKARATFEGLGRFTQAEGSTSSRTPPTDYDGGKASMLVRSITLTIGGTSYKLRAIDLNTNWSPEEDRNASGPSSLDRVELKRPAASRVGGTLSFADVALFEEVLDAYGTDATYALQIELTKGSDTITIDAPALQFGQYTREGGNIGQYSVPFFLNGDSGEDELTLTFT